MYQTGLRFAETQDQNPGGVEKVPEDLKAKTVWGNLKPGCNAREVHGINQAWDKAGHA